MAPIQHVDAESEMGASASLTAAAAAGASPEACDLPAETRWVVVSTHPHREPFAIDNLQRQDFQTYCPLMRKTVRHARRTSVVARPLFPGYVFVSLASSRQRWRVIHSTLGVRGVVMSGETPAALDGRFIAALKEREVDGAIVLPRRPYRRGQDVRFTGGAFDGVIATIEDLDDKGRIIVLMEVLNQRVRVQTQSASLREI